MSKSFSATTLILAATALAFTTASFAADAVFTAAERNHGMAINEFTSDMAIYNNEDVLNLVNAKTVLVVDYDTAWSDDADSQKATDALSNDAQSINLLREGIKANPAAVLMLESNQVDINRIVNIVSDGEGAVQIYIS